MHNVCGFKWYRAGIVLALAYAVTLEAAAQTAAPATPAGTAGPPAAGASSFADVAKQLDPNGTFYLYLSAAEFTKALDEALELLVPMCAVALKHALPAEEQAADREAVRGLAQLAALAFDESGVREISGVGLSCLAVEPGRYRTRSFVHHDPRQAQGKLWRALGQAPHPLAGLELLPQNTAASLFADLDLNLLWDWHKSLVANSQSPALIAKHQAALAAIRQVVDLEALIRSTAGEVGVIITLDPTRKIVIPGANIEMPEPNLALLLKVKDDTCRRFLETTLQARGLPIVKQPLGTGEATVVPLPLPLPLEVKPTIAMVEGYLVLSLNPALVQAIVDVKAGRRPGLAAAPEFQRLARDLPRQGNSFFYLSPSYTKVMNDIQLALARNLDPEFRTLLTKFYQLQNAEPLTSVAVGQVLPDGLLSTTYANVHPGRMLGLQLSGLPVMLLSLAVRGGGDGLGAAVAPAPADSVANLKQIGLACLMYAGENAGNFPSPDGEPGFTELAKQQILMPGQVYVHPQDRQRQVQAEATALTDKNCSYVYFGAGLADNDKELAKLPLAFEKFGITPGKLNVLFADGHVETFTAEVKTVGELVEFLQRKLSYSDRRYKALQIKAKNLDAGPAPAPK